MPAACSKQSNADLRKKRILHPMRMISSCGTRGRHDGRRSIMIAVKRYLAAFFLGLAVVAAASPRFAQRAENHRGGARARALGDRKGGASHYPQYTWGDTEITEYRDCM